MNGPGFYCSDNQADLMYSDTMIHFSDGVVLLAAEADQYSYPIRGWSWYQDEIEARAALGLKPLVIPEQELP